MKQMCMKRTTLLTTFGFLMLAIILAPAAHAQATRTWVSGVGDDANPCSRTAPCKTFAGAISKTAAGGEISVLDPGGFGGVTITKSITLNGDGTLAGILNAGSNGIIVNAGATDDVVIRGLSINGAGTGINGIRFLAGRSLTVKNCTISNFTTRGIDMSVATTAKLFVNDTTITDGGTGIFASTTSGQAQVMADHVHLIRLTNGLEASNNGRATITNSVISGNTGSGILASGSIPRINVDACQIAFNDAAGVNSSSATSIIRLSNNEIVNNGLASGSGITFVGGASIETAGDNRVAGNFITAPPNSTLNVD